MQGSSVRLPLALLLATPVVCGACGSKAPEVRRGDGHGRRLAVPSFTVDPTWPKEMPDDWILGSITGVFVDARDHVWVTHLPETLTPEEIAEVQDPPIGTCCRPAPAVIELDAEGNVVQGWGEPTQDISVYPRNPHGIFVDHNDFVWVGTYMHHRVMKFTRDGHLVLTIGRYTRTVGAPTRRSSADPRGSGWTLLRTRSTSRTGTGTAG